jgi:hypothetical protein
MAKKRAMVDGILTVTGASDIFTQDIEELPKEYLEQRSTPAAVTQPPAATQPPSPQPPVQAQSPSPILDGEPNIVPKSKKGTAPAQEQPPVQGEVVQGEPIITPPQAKRLFAISRSAGLSDDDVKMRLANLGFHGHRDHIPKSLYEAAIDAVDPDFKFHPKKV